jgi:PAS domain S-box-containing protein
MKTVGTPNSSYDVSGRVPESLMDELVHLRGRLTQLEAEVVRSRLAAQTAEARFRALTDCAPVMIWMSGPDARYIYFNRQWLEFRGRLMEEELGDGWTEGVHPDDLDICLETYMKAFVARRPFRLQYRLRRYDGDFRWIDESGVPEADPGGTFSGFVGSCADLSDNRGRRWMPDENATRAVFLLTEREREMLVLMAEGNSTKEVAGCLGISYKTADSHRSHILEKLGLHETASTVRLAIRAGLVEP